MLSNNFFIKTFQILLLVLLAVSCSNKEGKIPVLDFQNKTQLLQAVQKHFDKDANIAFGGYFDESGKQTIAVGRELDNNDEWGLKFTLLEIKDDEFKVKFESDLVEGSFKESFVDKIKFASFENELLYYNSKGYYMGSGGGEVFSYIVDFESKQVFYSHLVVEPSSAASLFISENTDNKEIRNFFNLTFKKDYPNLKLVADDIIID